MNTLWLLTAVLGGLVILFAWLGRRAHRRLLSTVRVVTLPEVVANELDNKRDIFVFLPRNYRTESSRCYPVLYASSTGKIGKR
ncbi:MAG: hypothetical protein R3C44_16605 [Chloroflexota bacterium]